MQLAPALKGVTKVGQLFAVILNGGVTAKLTLYSGTVPVFFNVAICVPLMLPEGTLPKFSGFGVSVTGGFTALPFSAAVPVPADVTTDRLPV